MIYLVVRSVTEASLELAQGRIGPHHELQQALDKVEALHINHQNDLVELTRALESSGRKEALIFRHEATISELEGQVEYGQRALGALRSENDHLLAQRKSISSSLVLRTLLWAWLRLGLL